MPCQFLEAYVHILVASVGEDLKDDDQLLEDDHPSTTLPNSPLLWLRALQQHLLPPSHAGSPHPAIAGKQQTDPNSTEIHLHVNPRFTCNGKNMKK